MSGKAFLRASESSARLRLLAASLSALDDLSSTSFLVFSLSFCLNRLANSSLSFKSLIFSFSSFSYSSSDSVYFDLFFDDELLDFLSSESLSHVLDFSFLRKFLSFLDFLDFFEDGSSTSKSSRINLYDFDFAKVSLASCSSLFLFK